MRNLGFAIVVSAIVGTPALAIPPNLQYFNSSTGLTQFCVNQGKSEKAIESFEESSASPGSKTSFPNPLQHGLTRPTLPNGIDATNLIIQTNITQSPHAPQPNPSASPNALWVNGQGFIGSNSIKVGTDEFLNNQFSSIDLIFTSHDKTGVGFDTSTFNGFNQGFAGFDIAIFDDGNNLLGTAFVPAQPPEPSKSFFGVWSAAPIGRVNIWGIFTIPQPFAVDNIQMWTTAPAPGAGALLGLGGLIALRRRR